MEKVAEEKIEKILKEMCGLMGVEITLVADAEKNNELIAHYDVNAVISKQLALFVYCGWNVQPLGPAYNRIHADIDWWKKQFEAEVVPAQVITESPAQ